MTLVEFLLARYAEDQAVIAWASGDGDGRWDEHAVGEYKAHFDGRRMLAECEAKRQIVELHEHQTLGNDLIGCRECDRSVDGDLNYSGWCDTLRLLALPFADHPDYRAEEWKP